MASFGKKTGADYIAILWHGKRGREKRVQVKRVNRGDWHL